MLKWLLYKPALNSRSTSNKVMLGKSFSNVKTDSTSHSSADTIAKLGLIGKITYVNNLLVPILLASQIAAFLKQQYLKNIFVNWHGYMHTDTNSENLEGDSFFFWQEQLSVNQMSELVWIFEWRYKIRKFKSLFQNFWLNVVKNGCDYALGESDGSIFKSAVNTSRTN